MQTRTDKLKTFPNNRTLKITNPAFQVMTNTYGGDGLRRSWQQAGQPVNTTVWDGSNYLGEVN